MGADATRLALGDAGVEWKDVQFAVGGSYEVDNPDSVVTYLGPRGIPFTNVYNGCATAATSLDLVVPLVGLGAYDMAVPIGLDKPPAGAFSADSVEYALPAWSAQTGPLHTTNLFGLESEKGRGRTK